MRTLKTMEYENEISVHNHWRTGKIQKLRKSLEQIEIYGRI